MVQIESPDVAPAGQSYFITDGTPIFNFQFLRPLCLARGRIFPSLIIPTKYMLKVAYIFEKLYLFSSYYLPITIEPFLVRAEVLKVGVSHSFSIEKAKKDFGYCPTKNSIEGSIEIAEYYKNNLLSNKDYFEFVDLVSLRWIMMMNIIMVVFLSQYRGYNLSFGIEIFNEYTFLPKQINLLFLIYGCYIFISTLCAIYAWKLSHMKGCENTWFLWMIQTFFVGYPSLMKLHQRKTTF